MSALRKFEDNFYRNLVPEWRDYYLNCECLRLNLLKLEEAYSSPESPFIEEFRAKFESSITAELVKFAGFFRHRMENSVRPQLVRLDKNVKKLEELRRECGLAVSDFADFETVRVAAQKKAPRDTLSASRAATQLGAPGDGQRATQVTSQVLSQSGSQIGTQAEANPEKAAEELQFALKNALSTFYKELTLLKKFLDQNTKAFAFLLKFYKRLSVEGNQKVDGFLESFDQNFEASFPSTNRGEFDRVVKTVEGLCLEHLGDFGSESPEIVLQKIATGENFSTYEGILLGVFVGVLLVCTVVAVLLLEELSFFSGAKDFTKNAFPVFRGTLVLFLYMLSLGVSVYIFDRFNINYRRCMRIFKKHSTSFQIMKRAFGFLCLWMFAFIYSATTAVAIQSKIIDNIFVQSVADWLPSLVYVIFLGYFLFPSKKVFNGKGRFWVAKRVLRIAQFPCILFDFSDDFITDQIFSIFPFLRDLSYTICYSKVLFETGSTENTCFESPSIRALEVSFLVIPYVIIFTQNFKALFDTKDPVTATWIKRNLCRHSLNAMTSAFSLLMGPFPYLRTSFYSLLVGATLFNTFWDIFRFWRLLEPNCDYPLLRKNRAIRNVSFYYFAIFSNIVLRFAWAIQMIPLRVYTNQLHQNIITLIASIVEMGRRTVFNTLKVEVEHLKEVGNFNVIRAEPLPYFSDLEELKNSKNFKQDFRAATHNVSSTERKFSEHVLKNTVAVLDKSFTEVELKKLAFRSKEKADELRKLSTPIEGVRERIRIFSKKSFGAKHLHSKTSGRRIRRMGYFRKQNFDGNDSDFENSIDEESVFQSPLFEKEQRIARSQLLSLCEKEGEDLLDFDGASTCDERSVHKPLDP